MSSVQRIIEVFEYRPTKIDADVIDIELGKIIEKEYRSKIKIRFPNQRNNNKWEIISKGYVGFISIDQEVSIRLSPKVSIGNLFLMLDYAYEFKGIEFRENLIHCDAIEDFYDRLATLMANRVLERVQKGLYKSYASEVKKFPCVRGKVNIKSVLRNPWDLKIECKYQKFTGNIDDNRIIAWTLFLIANSGACSRSLPLIRDSLQAIGSVVDLYPCLPEDCIDRYYHPLNESYKPLHSLCRFFLESSSASLRCGNYSMLSFLVDMATLFESFVASWLKFHLPDRYHLKKQERYDFTEDSEFPFFIDLVLYDLEKETVKCVIDTKYKPRIEPRDLQQIHFYAASQNSSDAVLVYPSAPDRFRDKFPPMKGITIRPVVFALDGDLSEAGQKFMKELLQE